jgi:hypothetical protein
MIRLFRWRVRTLLIAVAAMAVSLSVAIESRRRATRPYREYHAASARWYRGLADQTADVPDLRKTSDLFRINVEREIDLLEQWERSVYCFWEPFPQDQWKEAAEIEASRKARVEAEEAAASR